MWFRQPPEKVLFMQKSVRPLLLMAMTALLSCLPLFAHADAGRDDRPWAFRHIVRPAVPKAAAAARVCNPIDAFLLAKLEAQGLHFAPGADKITLIRRATFDLIGLPPTPAEVDASLKDKRPNAYEKLIDRLLASPHYGERWARHWLDLARYAESEGFKSDETRPNAWRYRDYVIQSLNADKPYDQFLKEQIAGDELYPNRPDALVATGFCRHWADESNARDMMLRRQEILNDITDTVGASLLGLTVGCARCHDHKYDPISQKDYYRLQAFFAAIQPRDDIPLATTEQVAQYTRQRQEWEQRTKTIREELAALEAPSYRRAYQEHFKKFPPEVQEAITTAPEKRTPLQWILFRKTEPQLQIPANEATAGMKPEVRQQWTELNRKLEGLKALKPAPLPVAIGITDVAAEAPRTYTLAVGVYNAPREEVQPGFLSLVDSRPPRITPLRPIGSLVPLGEELTPLASTGRRSALANWIAAPDNPLTARVIVNRLWQVHFGEGIVATPSDFGNAGSGSTHPELLDWLATELIRRGWSLKQMHRLLMTSSAYRQAAAFDPVAARRDPDNHLLWRFRRRRLEGEVVRDAMLAVSGQLNAKMGGPSVFPALPAGVTTRGGWKETAASGERNRRSIYVFVKRNLRYPLFEVFDMPDTHEPCGRRMVTTTAPQALTLLNSDLALDAAQHFAGRLLAEAANTPDAQIAMAYRLAFARPPDAEERRQARAFLQSQAQVLQQRLAQKQPMLLPAPLPAGVDSARAAALVDFCHALLNANEFVYCE
jgi:hypothetical protein